jgi:hypothetical protein
MRVSHYDAIVVVAGFAQPTQPASVFGKRLEAAA